METKTIRIEDDFGQTLDLALNEIEQGRVIAIPTDTVYGLAADLHNEKAARRIFELKKRDSGNPLTAFISDSAIAADICRDIPDSFYRLCDKFWPGPLSIVLQKQSWVPDIISGGLDTLSLRIPDNKFVIELLKLYGKPLATTSANISNQPSRKDISGIYDDFQHDGIMIFDDGPSKIGIESTVLSLADDPPRLIRQGALGRTEIEAVTGKLRM